MYQNKWFIEKHLFIAEIFIVENALLQNIHPVEIENIFL